MRGRSLRCTVRSGSSTLTVFNATSRTAQPSPSASTPAMLSLRASSWTRTGAHQSRIYHDSIRIHVTGGQSLTGKTGRRHRRRRARTLRWSTCVQFMSLFPPRLLNRALSSTVNTRSPPLQFFWFIIAFSLQNLTCMYADTHMLCHMGHRPSHHREMRFAHIKCPPRKRFC